MIELIEKMFAWCVRKIEIHIKNKEVLFKAGEVWWCSVGINIGHEAYGKGTGFTRPVLVLKKLSSNLFFGIPLTSQNKKGSWYVEIEIKGEKSFIVLSQARVFDTRRLIDRVSTLKSDQFERIKKGFIDFYSS